MNPVFTFDEIRTVEKYLIEKENIPSLLLMENAGRNIFDCIVGEFSDIHDYDIYIICGKGSNGGDGFTLARHCIINEMQVNVICLADAFSLKGDALINYNLLIKSSKNELLSFLKFDDFARRLSKSAKILIVDAIFGTGLKGSPARNDIDVISALNRLHKKYKKAKIVSIDVPSGLTSDISASENTIIVKADYTVTMGAYKTELLFGVGKENSGRIFAVPIGLDKQVISRYNSYGKYLVEQDDIKAIFPKRKRSSHKYSNGKVLIIGGSKGLSGALAMSSLSAVRSGAGGVVAAMPQKVSTIFGRKLYEVMKVELEETEDGTIRKNQFDSVKKRMDWADAVLIGPGISTNDETKEFVIEVILKCNKPLVIDADSLNILAEKMSVLKERNFKQDIILTPHPGEFSKLSGIEIKEIEFNRFEIAKDFAKNYDVHLVLKSETSISCLKNGDIYVNSSGNEALASAGTGDVLSGIIVSLLSRTQDAKSAMLCGNYLHGLCADLYFSKYKNKQTANPQDIIKLIPDAVTSLLENN